MQHMPNEPFISLAILIWPVDSWSFDYPTTVYIGNQDGINFLVIRSQVAAIKVALDAPGMLSRLDMCLGTPTQVINLIDSMIIHQNTLNNNLLYLLDWSSQCQDTSQETSAQLDLEPDIAHKTLVIEPPHGITQNSKSL